MPTVLNDSFAEQTLVQDAVQLKHYFGAGKKLLELQELGRGKDVATFAATGIDDLNVCRCIGIEDHGIKVNAINELFKGQKTGEFEFCYVACEIHREATFPVALINTAIRGPVNFL